MGDKTLRNIQEGLEEELQTPAEGYSPDTGLKISGGYSVKTAFTKIAFVFKPLAADYVLISDNKDVGVFDLKRGKMKQNLPRKHGFQGVRTFAEVGYKIVTAGVNEICLWD